MPKLTEKRLQKRPTGREVVFDGGGLRARGGPRGWTFVYQESVRRLDGKRVWKSETLGRWSAWGGAGTLTLRQARERVAKPGYPPFAAKCSTGSPSLAAALS